MNTPIRIAAVIVLYNESLQDSVTYQSLLASANIPFLVYDNSQNPEAHQANRDFETYHNSDNPGVSAAYNFAWNWAVKNEFSHLLILDSDSNFPLNAIEVYRKFVEKNQEQVIVPTMKSANRVISPFYFKLGKTHYGEGISYGEISAKNILSINSGMLVPISVFQLTNGYNENLPLDWGDIAFVRKLRKHGVKSVHIPLLVEHGLSEHHKANVESVKFRFEKQVEGFHHVAENRFEKWMMYFWLVLKSVKLTVKYKTIWFFKRVLVS